MPAIRTWRSRRRWRLTILPDTRTPPSTATHACGTAFKLARELEMHVARSDTRKKNSEASRRCRICGTYSEGDELVCLFCGGLVDAPVESDSGDSNPDGWRFLFHVLSFLSSSCSSSHCCFAFLAGWHVLSTTPTDELQSFCGMYWLGLVHTFL